MIYYWQNGGRYSEWEVKFIQTDFDQADVLRALNGWEYKGSRVLALIPAMQWCDENGTEALHEFLRPSQFLLEVWTHVFATVPVPGYIAEQQRQVANFSPALMKHLLDMWRMEPEKHTNFDGSSYLERLEKQLNG